MGRGMKGGSHGTGDLGHGHFRVDGCVSFPCAGSIVYLCLEPVLNMGPCSWASL